MRSGFLFAEMMLPNEGEIAAEYDGGHGFYLIPISDVRNFM